MLLQILLVNDDVSGVRSRPVLVRLPQVRVDGGGGPLEAAVPKEGCIASKIICYNEWALVEDNKQRGIFFKSRGHFRLPDCNTLPTLAQGSCSNAHLTDMREDGESLVVNCSLSNLQTYRAYHPCTMHGSFSVPLTWRVLNLAFPTTEP
ncbi:tyrosine-protein kinase transmembrane receptor Ror2 [Caerostris extrusa]|uniref:Tyrosine-protein kinase transmembrane receptor Ror2 n=1 Tax=Caerostris extrusa TaxID=172846 RepID=A0AAV4S9W7_CAEEX|nr:tyrosine-protein kinase transmembrane receptor Ror2 [Caerostris extrusa]